MMNLKSSGVWLAIDKEPRVQEFIPPFVKNVAVSVLVRIRPADVVRKSDGRQIGLKETLDLKAVFIDEYKTRLAGPVKPSRSPQAVERVQSPSFVRSRRIASPNALSIGGS